MRVSDPLQVAVLLRLKEQPAGATASDLWQSLKEKSKGKPTTLDDVEVALEKLADAKATGGAKQLVIADGQVWKCQV